MQDDRNLLAHRSWVIPIIQKIFCLGLDGFLAFIESSFWSGLCLQLICHIILHSCNLVVFSIPNGYVYIFCFTVVPGGTDGPSGVLICSENYITYKNIGDQPDIRCPIPRRRVCIFL